MSDEYERGFADAIRLAAETTKDVRQVVEEHGAVFRIPANQWAVGCLTELETRIRALTPSQAQAKVFGPTDEMIERLAQYIYANEAARCKTLEQALFHKSNWRRAVPEARAMLEAALMPPQEEKS